jgi:hypothetical protein
LITARPTFALLVLESCRHAVGRTPPSDRTGDALAALDHLTAAAGINESSPLRQVLGAALDTHRLLEKEGRAPDALLPETIRRLDAVLTAVMQGSMRQDHIRPALRRALTGGLV